MPTYKEVSAATVPEASRRAARKALDYACARLGLALPPEIRWIRDSTEASGIGTVSYPQPIAGLTNSSAWAMWLRADLSPRQAAHVAAHETAHLYHRLRNSKHALSREDEEADCEAFAARVVEALGR